jgi:hypothetical protein
MNTLSEVTLHFMTDGVCEISCIKFIEKHYAAFEIYLRRR